jgi:ribonuclease HI
LTGGGGDLGYALKMLASGKSIEEVWNEAGFASRKKLADAIFSLAAKLPAGGATSRMRVIAYSDGASIGNPGEAGCGVLILGEDGSELAEESRYLGRATNNVAEYQGAILALEKALDLGASEVELRLDSELVASQIKGEYRVKNPTLAQLYKRLKQISKQFEVFEVQHVERKLNRKADNLANLAIAAHEKDGPGAG